MGPKVTNSKPEKEQIVPLYELREDEIVTVNRTSFQLEGVQERTDLQRLLLNRLDVIAPNTMVITEEFSDWDDSNRRIDILALDQSANLVVIELKRTADGGHMDLQALRYAAMVSTMTFDQVIKVHNAYLEKCGITEDPKTRILNFLGWPEPEEDKFANDVRIVLVAEDFSKEITSAVLWLNKRDLDITCVRLHPYKWDGRLILDAQQVIPLPEAAEYQIRVRTKEQVERSQRRGEKDLPTIWREFSEKCTPEVLTSARDIFEWLEPRVTAIFPTTNSFAPKITANGVDYYFFKVTTDGHVEVWFQYMMNKTLLAELSIRRDLLAKLNEIPGVSISEERLAGKPKFRLEVLSSKEAMLKFNAAFEWLFAILPR
jgi:hypothetical protein